MSLVLDTFPVDLDALEAAGRMLCPVRFFATATPTAPAAILAGGSVTYAELDARISSERLTARPDTEGLVSPEVVRAGSDIESVVRIFAAMRRGVPVFLQSSRLPVATLGDYASRARRYRQQPSPDDPFVELASVATMMLTSGSGGRPRIAAHSARNHYASAAASGLRTAFDSCDCWLLSLPLYHVGGLATVFRAFCAGGSIGIPEKDAPIADSIAGLHATHVSLVETQLIRLLDELKTAPGYLREILVGGGPVSAALVRRAVDGGWPVRTTYGMTEFSSQIATSGVWTERRDVYSCGHPLDGFMLRIRDDGELAADGPGRFAGYLEGDRLVCPTGADGLFQTGDIGRIEKGQLYVDGRKDEMFVSGGENIHPEEIERVMSEVPEIERAVVVPVDDKTYGQRPVAFVKWTAGPMDISVLRRRLSAKLPTYKIPDAVLEWPPATVNSVLKVDRKRFRLEAGQRLGGSNQD